MVAFGNHQPIVTNVGYPESLAESWSQSPGTFWRGEFKAVSLGIVHSGTVIFKTSYYENYPANGAKFTNHYPVHFRWSREQSNMGKTLDHRQHDFLQATNTRAIWYKSDTCGAIQNVFQHTKSLEKTPPPPPNFKWFWKLYWTVLSRQDKEILDKKIRKYKANQNSCHWTFGNR